MEVDEGVLRGDVDFIISNVADGLMRRDDFETVSEAWMICCVEVESDRPDFDRLFFLHGFEIESGFDLV